MFFASAKMIFDLCYFVWFRGLFPLRVRRTIHELTRSDEVGVSYLLFFV